MIRDAGNKGLFYPNSCKEIESMIDRFNKILDSAIKDKSILQYKPKAIISPHAGYIYSGFTANIAHRLLKNNNPKRVVVIGPSHHVYFEGVSVSLADEYETPCNTLEIDTQYSHLMAKKYNLLYIKEAHYKEHSTETQMPFIKHYLPNAKVVEYIYGKINYQTLIPLIEDALSQKDTAVVISTDLSHFYTLKEAKELDAICLTGVAKEDISILQRGCEACGKIGVEAIIAVAKKMGLKSKVLDYRTSADTSGDSSRVVGYMSAIFL